MQFHNFITSTLYNNYYKINLIFFYISEVDNYFIRLRALTYYLNFDFFSYIRNNK